MKRRVFVILVLLLVSISIVSAEWIPAKNLNVGNKLLTENGKTATITGIKQIIPDNPFLVYNLEAGIYHNFISEGNFN